MTGPREAKGTRSGGGQVRSGLAFELEQVVAALPPALAIGGAVVYGVLILAYSEFYSELGVRPGEVGLQYGPALGGIAGVAIALLLMVPLGFGLMWLYVKTLRRRFSRLPRPGLWLLVFSFVVMSAFLLVFLTQRANEQADAAKDGKPVEPFRILGLEIVSFRADPAKIKLVDPKAETAGAYADVRDRKNLMYLGRSAGVFVLYDADPKNQSSIHLPTATFAIRALNCETKRQHDPACKK